MTQDELSRRLLLTSEICQQLQLYAQEITRENVSRAYLESFASRALKRCAELYSLSRPAATAPAEPAPSPNPSLQPQPARSAVLAAVYTRDDCPFNYCDTAPPHTPCRTRCRHNEGAPNAA